MSELRLAIGDARAMERLGHALAPLLLGAAKSRDEALVVFLEGDLGAGKTTLTRGILRALGHSGPVRSPTFTIVEPYELQGLPFYHLDLYRLGDPEELALLGARDFLGHQGCCLIEWPGAGAGCLPEPALVARLGYQGEGREVVLKSAQLDLSTVCHAAPSQN